MIDIRDKKPRKRASTPRSRTGCITCKIRRLKCGEEKPGCVRCLKSGWQCDYDQPVESQSLSSRPPNSGLIPRSPRSSSISAVSTGSRAISPIQAQLSSSNPLLPGDLEQHEQPYFQRFLDDGATNLHNGDATCWRRVAVEQSHASPCIRHAIVAIGALGMSTKKSPSGCHIMDVTECGHRQFALQQYEKAIIALRNAISSLDHQQGETSRVIIISCLVLACFDKWIGNGGFAVQHVRYARTTLFKSGTALEIPPATPDWNNINEVLGWIFLCLDMQVLNTMGADEDRTSVVMEPQTINTILPPSFTDLDEAQQYLKLILWDANIFLYQASSKFSPLETVSQSSRDLRDHLIAQIHFFHAALEPLLAEEWSDLQCHPLHTASSLRLHSMVVLVKLSLSLNSPEMGTDTLQPYFKYILSFCRDIMEFEAQADNTIGKTPKFPFSALGHEIFTMEVRIAEPLFLVATKCRDGAIRRQAISLLLCSHRRELMWDSLIAGNIADWVMGIEEEGIDAIGYIPDTNRVWGIAIELDLHRKLALGKCRVGIKNVGEYSERTTELACDGFGWSGIS
ncbi:uncharacterized protein BP5553_00152 [Venustampulla echinocandica]|uniref:Zn(2)-C6 fungal-type domain-containing protein n=1 Tax=Venustampulla echinocandica TaxID=2656787 RepID=A0A370TXC9_9HELO|nr:uncharacterized protein BP5553_00152 [Venustampulla echinocandica]RDL40173.1 hypothetical protein BP5553_00152 [Venustampulla echinocandica]